jgi:hypothetical protein
MFRDKFWLSLALTIPTIVWSSDVQRWLGYDAPSFPRSALIPPTFGTIVFFYGGWVFDALAANTLPSLQRAVKWGMAYYGVGGGWCFSSGAFVGHVKLMFIRGTEIKPEPPVTPIGMGKSTRGVELASVDDLDEHQVASWMKQAAANPFVGGKKR